MTLKSSRYRHVEPAALNRRNTERRQVEITAASVGRGRKKPLHAKVVDVSAYGCRLEVDSIFRENEIVEISLDSIEPIEANIVWQKARQAGCRFTESISASTLKALTATG